MQKYCIFWALSELSNSFASMSSLIGHDLMGDMIIMKMTMKIINYRYDADDNTCCHGDDDDGVGGGDGDDGDGVGGDEGDDGHATRSRRVRKGQLVLQHPNI